MKRIQLFETFDTYKKNLVKSTQDSADDISKKIFIALGKHGSLDKAKSEISSIISKHLDKIENEAFNKENFASPAEGYEFINQLKKSNKELKKQMIEILSKSISAISKASSNVSK